MTSVSGERLALRDERLPDATFEHVDLSRARFDRVDLTGSRFEMVDFAGVEFRDVAFRKVRMRGVQLEDVEISGELKDVRVNGIDVWPLVSAELDEAREDLMVSVAQEGLRNVERHAGATEVVLTLAFSADAVELVIQDDGVGLPAGVPHAGSGLGLGILREEIARVGGEARLARSEDTGSTMRARIPLV